MEINFDCFFFVSIFFFFHLFLLVGATLTVLKTEKEMLKEYRAAQRVTGKSGKVVSKKGLK